MIISCKDDDDDDDGECGEGSKLEISDEFNNLVFSSLIISLVSVGGIFPTLVSFP